MLSRGRLALGAFELASHNPGLSTRSRPLHALVLNERSKGLLDVRVEDCRAYMAFIADVPAAWISRAKPPQISRESVFSWSASSCLAASASHCSAREERP